jgi:anti-sigma factor RsiW
MKCSDVSNRLVDFLYEEMPAEERREFVAHVDGCASCSAEVKAMSSTLGHARAALRGPLDETPPPNLRARILQAAEAATTAKVVETSRVGSPPASPAAYHRGRAWEPSQGSHVRNDGARPGAGSRI